MSTHYPSSLSDAEWAYLQQQQPLQSKRGRPPIHSLRAIFDAIFYVLRTGCPWRAPFRQLPAVANGVLPLPALAPPGDVDPPAPLAPPSRTATTGQESAPRCSSHGCGIGVKTVEESAGISGFDADIHVKGRKRHLLVDTLGIPLSIYVTEADVHDTRGARCLLAGLKCFVPHLQKIWADAAYRGQELASWCTTEGEWEREVVERESGQRGFSIQPRRWVVERTFSWISREP